MQTTYPKLAIAVLLLAAGCNADGQQETLDATARGGGGFGSTGV